MEMMSMVLDTTEVETKLAEIITRGDFRCFRCGKPLGGSAIQGMQLEASDGKPKVLYTCDNPVCPNNKKGGYRTLLSLGIADNLKKIEEASPLLAARPPENMAAPALIVMGVNGPEMVTPLDEDEDEDSDADSDEDEDSDEETDPEDIVP